ncbi:MAG TPA: ABC transporter substrate-binding protein [Rhodopila sp.]|nr:ABC transporter substrate-binding protein [Rhodopila sp.]
MTGLPVAVALPVQAANESPPVEPIQQLINGLLQIMKAGPGTPFQQRFDILAPIIDRTFDLSAILEESVGGSWSTLPPDQQKTLADAFRRYTVASYVNSFDDYNGQHFTVSPDTRTVGAQQVVQTQVIPKNGNSHELDYVMRQTSAGWRVVDVLADGSISRVAVQRSDFRRLLARGGAQALAESLRTKSTDLFEGAS